MQSMLNLALFLAAIASANPLETDLGRAWQSLREGNTALYHAYVSAGTFTVDFAKRMVSPAPDQAYDAQLAAYSVSMNAWQDAANAFVKSGVAMPTGVVVPAPIAGGSPASVPPSAAALPAAAPSVDSPFMAPPAGAVSPPAAAGPGNTAPAGNTPPAADPPPAAGTPPADTAPPAQSPPAASPPAAAPPVAPSSPDSPSMAPPAGATPPANTPPAAPATIQSPAASAPPASAPAEPPKVALPDKAFNLFGGLKASPAASPPAPSMPTPAPPAAVPTGFKLFDKIPVAAPPTTPAPPAPSSPPAAEEPDQVYDCGKDNEKCPPVKIFASVDGSSVQVTITGIPFSVANKPGYNVPGKFLPKQKQGEPLPYKEPGPDEVMYGRTMVGKSTFEAYVEGLTFCNAEGGTPEGQDPPSSYEWKVARALATTIPEGWVPPTASPRATPTP